MVTDAEKCRDGCLQAVSSDTNAALETRMQKLQHRSLRNAVYWLAPTGVLVATLVGGTLSVETTFTNDSSWCQVDTHTQMNTPGHPDFFDELVRTLRAPEGYYSKSQS